MSGNTAFELRAGHVGRIRLIIQIHLYMPFHGTAKDAGCDFGHIEETLFIVDLSYDICKDQGRNIQAVHLQGTVDDRSI